MRSEAEKKVINVLVLEDRASDAELMMSQLEASGFTVVWQRVETAKDFAGCLHPGLDVIVADFQLPQFDALQALQLLREQGLDIPFIIVSGKVNDNFIVEAMKQGAADFLLKDRMARLGVAVEGALERKRLRALHDEMVHKLRQAMAESERNHSQLEAVFEAVADGIVVFDMDGKIIMANESQARLIGFSDAGEMKRHISYFAQGYELSQPDGTPVPLDQWPPARVLRGESIVNWELRVRHKETGREWFFSYSGQPVRNERGFQILAVITTHDVTKRRQAEGALAIERSAVETVNQTLAEKNQQLSELYLTAQRFVDDVSHEFRTPLSVIKGYSELMREGVAGPQTPEQKRFSQLIIDRARDMAQMVDDLLDTSKLRAGSLRVDRRPCAVASIFAALHPILDARLAAHQMEWVEEIPQDLPLVFADAEKATRVLVNLAINAIKFSPAGSRIVLSAKAEGNGDVRISVADQGPGISPENLAIIFERFRQVGHTSGIAKGFGLGLNIAKELVSLNLGQMGIVSEVQKGSTFSFTVPVDEPKVIVARLLSHLERSGHPAGVIAVLRVTPACGGATTAELRGFLASSAHPGDVILSTEDDTALILFGYSAKPVKWHQRLVDAGRNIEQFSPTQKLCAFEIELLSTLPYPATAAETLAIVLGQLEAQLV